MCGICGVRFPGELESLEATITAMTSTLVHRGPDGGGVFVAEGVALGHRRLSIIDLTAAAAQPMSSEFQEITVVYNGEIYNFQHLRRQLEASGRLFRSQSDTEVILGVYERWGMDGLRRLEGIFSLAIWDESLQRLVLMRDRLGVKPLFYARCARGLIFGSEIKAILAATCVDTAIDDQALSEYLWYGNAFQERTIYGAIRAVPPGHWLIDSDGAQRTEPWWRIEDWIGGVPQFKTLGDAATAVREAVDAAVARQLVSDVPVGLFLSGGVDSSTIAAAAARAAGGRLSSYAVAFDYEGGINELAKARRVAALLGLDHHELTVTGAGSADVIMDLVRAHDEPFADAANIPLYLLARALGGQVKVVLQGDGGDEMFAGYRRYAILRNLAAWKAWPGFLTLPVRSMFGELGERFARITDATGAQDPAMRMALLLTVDTLRNPATSLLEDRTQRVLAERTDPFLAYRESARRFAGFEPVQQMLLTDVTLQLPSQFLAKVDRATMAMGLEARVPLLDEGVAKLAVNLPSRYKVAGAEKKIVLREAMRARLPADILDGPKTGFGVPYQHWLRTSLYEPARDAVLAPAFLTRFGFARDRVVRALEEHRSQRRDHGFKLWKAFQLALWAEAQL